MQSGTVEGIYIAGTSGGVARVSRSRRTRSRARASRAIATSTTPARSPTTRAATAATSRSSRRRRSTGLALDTGIELTPAETRRNVLTRGVALNDLVGRRFTVGEVECVGRRLCDPCSHLEKLTQPGVLKGLVDRGGLRADIVRGGTIRAGDELRELGPA